MKKFIMEFLYEEEIEEVENDVHLISENQLIKLLKKDRAQQLILNGVGCSEPKEIPKTLTFEGKNYVSKQVIKELIEKGELILV